MLNILGKIREKPNIKKKKEVVVEIARYKDDKNLKKEDEEKGKKAEDNAQDNAEKAEDNAEKDENAEKAKNVKEMDESEGLTIKIKKKPKKGIKIVSDNLPSKSVYPDKKPTIPIIKLPMPKKEAKENINIRAPAYIMNNREEFTKFINKLFLPYKKLLRDSGEITCDNLKDNVNRELMIHQQIVKDYINLFTPYRGLLLYHGLGSGKTCSSISIAEGMKSQKQVIILSPASLHANYLTQLKECGDVMYKLNQHWEWNEATNDGSISELHEILSISKSIIRKNKGAWLVDLTKPSNYSSLTQENKESLNKQIDEMINLKYFFIHYNGLRLEKWLEYNNGRNFFDNKVIVVDEAHNFISLIVNKLNSIKSKTRKADTKKPLPVLMYESLMSCNNSKIVLLTGTPVVNYANEIGILFNILRGYIKTYELVLDFKDKLDKEEIYRMILNDIDYHDYSPSTKTLTITENPLGFENVFQGRKYAGVTFDNNHQNFLDNITKIFSMNGIRIVRSNVEYFKCLPDTLEEFTQMFINGLHLKNTNLLKKRIVGLTSYFKSAQEELMPSYNVDKDLHIREIYMSDYQFEVYEKARINERQTERNAKKSRARQTEDEAASSYRVFSRLFCNFVMPEEIGRPMPKDFVGGMPKGQFVWSKKKWDYLVSLPKGAPLDYDDDEEDDEKNSDEVILVEGVAEEKQSPKRVEEEAEDEKDEKDEKADEKDERAEKDEKDEKDAEEAEVQEDEEYASIEVREGEDEMNIKGSLPYERSLIKAFNNLVKKSSVFLTEESLSVLSPKYLDMLHNIKNPEHIGLHLVYSQFRPLEGVGIFGEVLKANGFVQFKIEKKKEGWDIVSPLGIPSFAFYSGTESREEKELVRKIFNGEWMTAGFPPLIFEKLRDYESNMYGEVIKVLMITASGSEGINLKNTRYVHIMEPYWHPARSEQVIGRARRICSHQQLPEELRTVEVFIYIMIFTKEQTQKDTAVELRKNDTSKRNPRIYLTSDGALYEINLIKSEMIKQITQVIKESAIDCAIHTNEDLKCMTSSSNPSGFITPPSYKKDTHDKTRNLNVETKTWQAMELRDNKGKFYALNEETGVVYDYDDYGIGILTQVGVFRDGKIIN
uniref:Helicase ATP-binding domain-containing protein n=1 Tax=viral metagenome TaxID=1070528 RepID=A0A6C0HRF5_9ZZZZ